MSSSTQNVCNLYNVCSKINVDSLTPFQACMFLVQLLERVKNRHVYFICNIFIYYDLTSPFVGTYIVLNVEVHFLIGLGWNSGFFSKTDVHILSGWEFCITCQWFFFYLNRRRTERWDYHFHKIRQFECFCTHKTFAEMNVAFSCFSFQLMTLTLRINCKTLSFTSLVLSAPNVV